MKDLTRKHTRYRTSWHSVNQDTCDWCDQLKWVNPSGTCLDCFEPRTVTGYTQLCQTCVKTTPNVCPNCTFLVTFLHPKSGLCPTCTYGDKAGWMEYPKGKNASRHCAGCNRYLLVDQEGICIHCYTDSRLKEARALGDKFALSIRRCKACDEFTEHNRVYCNACEKRRRRCPDCKSTFSARSEEQWLCDDCLPKCRGCDSRVISLKRDSVLCDDCVAYKRNNYCTRCKVKSNHLTEVEGWCFNCAEEMYDTVGYPPGHICWRCDKEKVEEREGVCLKCKLTSFECPSCKEKNVEYDRVICRDCEQEHYTS